MHMPSGGAPAFDISSLRMTCSMIPPPPPPYSRGPAEADPALLADGLEPVGQEAGSFRASGERCSLMKPLHFVAERFFFWGQCEVHQ